MMITADIHKLVEEREAQEKLSPNAKANSQQRIANSHYSEGIPKLGNRSAAPQLKAVAMLMTSG